MSSTIVTFKVNMSSSSSSSSDDTVHPPCQEQCFKDCPNGLWSAKRDAVVTIVATTVLSNQAAGTLPTALQYSVLTNVSTGFFVAGGEKNQGVIQTDAAVVVLNPTYIAQYNPFPAPASIPVGTLPSGLVANNYPLQAGRIIAYVTYPLEHEKAKIMPYELRVLAVDAFNNVATLVIDDQSAFNNYNGNPERKKCLRQLPFLLPDPGSSYATGDNVFVIAALGDPVSPLVDAGQNGLGLLQGTITKRTYIDPLGRFLGDCGVLDITGLGKYSRGAPVINQYGKYIGMVLGPLYGDAAGAESGVLFVTNRSYITQQLRCLKYYRKSDCAATETNGVIATGLGYVVPDTPWLGFNYRVVGSDVWDETLTQTTTAPYLNPQYRLTATGLAADPPCRRIAGVQVLTVGGLNLPIGATGANGLFTPGGTTVQTGFTGTPVGNPPAYGLLVLGDIVESLQDVPFGNQSKQMSFFSIASVEPPCEPCKTATFRLVYRKESEAWTKKYTLELPRVSRPPILHYPWSEAWTDQAIAAPVVVVSPVLPVPNMVNSV